MRKSIQVHFSSQTPEWATPQYVFDELNSEFQFTLDPATTPENAKCQEHYTIKEDGLKQSWDGHRVFCNPPYGRVITNWVGKLATANTEISVGLLPARTDTKWFHEHILGKAEIRFIKGRLKFGGATTPAPFPSMVVVWKN
jgi:phage N-6-adenine-methyltransferase